jgi:hypothetical protein
MSRFFFSLLIFACWLPRLSAAEVEFVRVWPAWRDTESFERIGEYFGQPENTGREVVVRTQPASRDGYYFLVRVKAPAGSAENARFELNVIRPDHPEAKTFTFPATLKAKETVFQLGLTGADWPGGKEANPVAWKLALLDANGRVLAEHKSFLWEKPAK